MVTIPRSPSRRAEADLPNRKPGGVGAGRLVGLSGNAGPGGLPALRSGCGERIRKQPHWGGGGEEAAEFPRHDHLPPSALCLYSLREAGCTSPCSVPSIATLPHHPSPFLNSSFSDCFIRPVPAIMRDISPALNQAGCGWCFSPSSLSGWRPAPPSLAPL